jgi:hypothetical protein
LLRLFLLSVHIRLIAIADMSGARAIRSCDFGRRG